MSYYDSSTLTKRRQNKVIANDFINRINTQNTTSYGPALGISESSIINQVANGQMKYIRKCDGSFSIDNGCPCEAGANVSQSSGPVPLVNWPAFIVGNDSTTDMLSVSYSVSDDSQRVYITGLFSGTVNLFHGGVTDTTSEPWVIQLVTSTAAYDGFIACYSSSGQVLWATAIETRTPGNVTEGFTITDDATGVYVSGVFGNYTNPTTPPIVTGTVDFYNGVTSGVFDGTGPADATLTTTASGTQTTKLAQFIVKYDTTGVIQWVNKIDNYLLLSPPTEPKGFQYAICTNGTYVFVAGNFLDNTTLYNSGSSGAGSIAYQFQLSNSTVNTHLTCYDTTGAFVWATYMNNTGGTSIGTGLTCDATHVYITGLMGQINYYDTTVGKTSPAPLNPYGTLTAPYSGAFIISYTVGGVFNWASQASQTSTLGGLTFGQSMSVDASGLYVAVIFTDSVDVYDAGLINFVSISNTGSVTPPNASFNYAIIKYTLSGSIAWIQQINNIGDTASGVPYFMFGSSISSDGNGVYFTSSYRLLPITVFTAATATGPGPATTTLSPIEANQSTDAYILKYDTAGTLQWMTAIGGIGAQNGHGVVTNGTDIYVSGVASRVTYFYNANGTSQPSVIGAALNPSPSPAQFTYLAKYNSNGQLVN